MSAPPVRLEPRQTVRSFKRDTAVRKMVKKLRKAMPWLDRPEFAPVVRALARTILRAEGYDQGDVLVGQKLDDAVLRHSEKAGGTPATRAILGKRDAIDLPALFARLKDAADQGEQSPTEPENDGDDDDRE